MSYESDRLWSDLYLPFVKGIVGPFLIETAPDEQDKKRATDLVVLYARNLTIGVRVRRTRYYYQYPGQFTIRSSRPSGADTELKKIVNGWCDLLFYGCASGNLAPAGESGLRSEVFSDWMLIDLAQFRAACIRFPSILHGPYGSASGVRKNPDGTGFMWFQSKLLPPAVVMASPTIKNKMEALAA